MITQKNLRSVLSNAYGIQALRIQTGSRIVSDFYSNILPPSEGDTEKDDKEKARVLDKLRKDYNTITEGIVRNIPTERNFIKNRMQTDLIADYTRLLLIDQYLELEQAEGRLFKRLEVMLDSFPVYNEFLAGVKGCGPAMSAVLLSYIDFSKAKYVSSIWRYLGLDVVTETETLENGEITEVTRARGRRASHLIDLTYTDRNGDEKTRKSLTYNPFVRSKVLGVLGTCFLRAKDSPYKVYYDNYKNRINTNHKYDNLTKAHKHRMAIRYMVQRFIKDLYVAGRTAGGFVVSPEYHEVYHGHVHGSPADARANNLT